jgi:hypothetical protein
VAAGQAPRLTPVVIDIKIIGGETMTRIVHAFTLGLLLNAGSALGLTVEAGVAGPLLKAESLRQLVKQKASGAVAAIPDIEQGGSHRLRVLVTTEYLAPSSYSYLVEMKRAPAAPTGLRSIPALPGEACLRKPNCAGSSAR